MCPSEVNDPCRGQALGTQQKGTLNVLSFILHLRDFTEKHD